MMIKMTKEEVATACAHWLKGKDYINNSRQTTGSLRIAIHEETEITCKHTRGGAECTVTVLRKPKTSSPKQESST